MVLIFSFSIKGDHHLARARFFSDEFFNEESESERVYIYIRTQRTPLSLEKCNCIQTKQQRKTNIVRSSCAVKIRNLLLESCSAIRKEREGMSSPSADLLLSLFSIVSVLNVFPFTENSAEIEMINEGFKTRITEKERRELVAAYKQISDGVGDKTIEEALR